MANSVEKTKAAGLHNIPTPAEIMNHLNSFVIGQEEAKKTLSVAVYNHYRRLQLTAIRDEKQKWSYGKSNIILLGPTGCGKTALVKCLANYLGVPCYIADATTITQAGYVGDDVETLLVGLLRACDHDIEKAQRGIVFIDEIDKIAKRNYNANITRDVVGEGVQQALLKIVEGNIVGVPPRGGRKHPEAELVYVDTTNILFIASGAFVGMEDIIRKRLGHSINSIGFTGTKEKKEDEKEMSVLSRILPEDLYRFGMIPEFVGRFPIVTYVNPLRREDLVNIISKPEDSLLRQYTELLGFDGIQIMFTRGAFNAIADLALEMGTGARALRSVMEMTLRDLMFDAPSYRGLKSKGFTDYIITEDMVREKAQSYLSVG